MADLHPENLNNTRDRRMCTIVCPIFIFALIATVGIIVTFYFLTPSVKAEYSISLSGAAIGNDSRLTAEFSFTARNLDRWSRVSYSDVEAALYRRVSDEPLSSTKLPPFALGPRGEATLVGNFSVAGKLIRNTSSFCLGLRIHCMVKATRIGMVYLEVLCPDFVVLTNQSSAAATLSGKDHELCSFRVLPIS